MSLSVSWVKITRGVVRFVTGPLTLMFCLLRSLNAEPLFLSVVVDTRLHGGESQYVRPTCPTTPPSSSPSIWSPLSSSSRYVSSTVFDSKLWTSSAPPVTTIVLIVSVFVSLYFTEERKLLVVD